MKRILVVNPFGLGDVIFTLRVLEGIKNAAHDASIDLVGNERTVELIRSHASVNESYAFNRDHIRQLRGKNFFAWAGEYKLLVEVWRSRKYDLMLDYSLGREFSFLGFLAGIRVRAGLNYKNRGVFLTHKLPFLGYEGKSVFEFQSDLLRVVAMPAHFPSGKLSFKLSAETHAAAQRFLREFDVDHGKRLALAPGGGRSWGENARFKQWDAGRFVDVANRWAQDTGGKVILIGDESEKSLLRDVSRSLEGKHASMIGYALPEVMSVLQKCHSFLGNDGGLAHLAYAMGVPSAVIFGPVDERVYAPFGIEVPLSIIKEGVSCRPCYKKFHFPVCRHDRACLDQLSVDTVYNALKKIT